MVRQRVYRAELSELGTSARSHWRPCFIRVPRIDQFYESRDQVTSHGERVHTPIATNGTLSSSARAPVF